MYEEAQRFDSYTLTESMIEVFRPPFSKRVAVSKGMSLDVLRTSSRTIAMDEIPYAERARQGVPMSFGHLQSGGLF